MRMRLIMQKYKFDKIENEFTCKVPYTFKCLAKL